MLVIYLFLLPVSFSSKQQYNPTVLTFLWPSNVKDFAGSTKMQFFYIVLFGHTSLVGHNSTHFLFFCDPESADGVLLSGISWWGRVAPGCGRIQTKLSGSTSCLIDSWFQNSSNHWRIRVEGVDWHKLLFTPSRPRWAIGGYVITQFCQCGTGTAWRVICWQSKDNCNEKRANGVIKECSVQYTNSSVK